MKPIRTASMGMVYHGPNSDIGDLPCQRMQDGQIRSVWQPSPTERRMIAEGGNIEVMLYAEPIPPLSVIATDDQELIPSQPESADANPLWLRSGE